MTSQHNSHAQRELSPIRAIAFAGLAAAVLILVITAVAGLAAPIAEAQDAPPNDDVSNAELLQTDALFTAFTTDATEEAGEPAGSCYGPASKTLWYRWDAPADGRLLMFPRFSTFGPVISVFTSSNDEPVFDNFSEVTCNEFFDIQLPVEAGDVLFIQVGGQQGSFGEIELSIEFEVAPTCVISGVTVTTVVPVSQAECDGLVAFYASTNGSGWIDQTGWDTIGTEAPSDPCGWFGVNCDQGGIQSLALRDNGLAGVVPQEIQAFTNMRWIDIYSDSCLTPEDQATDDFLVELGAGFSLCRPCTAEQPASTPALGPLDPSAGWLETVNWYRAGSGLAPVTENSEWSSGIAAHATYLANTPAHFFVGEYANRHRENPDSPFYTPEGDAAGRSSNLTYGRTSDQSAIASWMTAPFHAIGILRPRLEEAAFYRDPSSAISGLDVIRGISGFGRCSDAILFPGNNSTTHLTSFLGENPDPLETCSYTAPAGLPLVAMMSEKPHPQTTTRLIDVWGNEVPSCLVSEHTYFTTDTVYGPTGLSLLQQNTLFIIPRNPLTAPRYKATITQPGEADISWSFNVSATGETLKCDGETVTVFVGLGDVATEDADVILGTPGDDEIDALGGDDLVCGEAGNDTIVGGLGDDTIHGGEGDDRLIGSKGADTIAGGAGADVIHGNRGADWLYGGDGDDRIFGYAQADHIWGGAGNDRLHGNTDDDVIRGGDGNDRIFGYANNDALHGGPGFDLITGNFGDDVINGDDGNDVLFGGDGKDTVTGGSGDDKVNGNSSQDVLAGGAGNDTLDGGIDWDFCSGNGGIDTATRCEVAKGVS